jgi:hypothetical protein
VQTANPHPPTVLALMLPTVLLTYRVALAAWALAMIFVFAATFWVLGVKTVPALALGVAAGLTFPGAYGISNVVPIIGLGIAIAYRWRDNPMIAGLGIALAAAPKSSGLLLVVPFLLSGRVRATLSAAMWYGITAVVPLIMDPHIWSNYFSAGLSAVAGNSRRGDNASLLHVAHNWGVPHAATVLVIAGLALGVALVRKDLFWPAAWSMVASLPVAWMYSALTFTPLIVWAILRSPRRSAPLAILAIGFTVGSAPLGNWGPIAFPIVTAIVLVLLLTAEPERPPRAFWLVPLTSWERPWSSRIGAHSAGVSNRQSVDRTVETNESSPRAVPREKVHTPSKEVSHRS